MPDITTLFFDVGGVLLTNGWDSASRRATVDLCGLDWEEFEDRHQLVSSDFELGKLSLEDYLTRTVFYRARPFAAEVFIDHMRAQSQAMPESMDLAAGLAASGDFELATLNNESWELNDYRIEKFGLRRCFSAFFSSCYLGVKKPEPEIFRLVLDITQRAPEECVFVDDRPLNLECAARARINTIHFVDSAQLRSALRAVGVDY